MLKQRQAVLLMIMLVLMIAPSVVLGAGIPSQIVPTKGCDGPGGCQSVCALADLAQNILGAAIFIAVFLAAILFAYAGFQLVTSSANSSSKGKAKTLLYSVLVGFIIILSAWLVINVLMSIMVTGSAGGLPWNRIC